MGLYKHEYEKPANVVASGVGCTKCGHAPDADVHKVDELVPLAVQRSKQHMREHGEKYRKEQK